jgi:hypothetical protein
MSLDIALYNGDEEIISMNWFRNPFGLCQWAEDNVGDDDLLWHVCNDWAGCNAPQVNRKLFQDAVHSYYRRLNQNLDFYFFFNQAQYKQFIKPYLDFFPLTNCGIKDSMESNNGCIAIPMHHFDNDMPEKLMIRRRGDIILLEQYRDWFAQLVHFSDLLQNTNYSFHCSN